jgi:hypothetical protein
MYFVAIFCAVDSDVGGYVDDSIQEVVEGRQRTTSEEIRRTKDPTFISLRERVACASSPSQEAHLAWFSLIADFFPSPYVMASH